MSGAPGGYCPEREAHVSEARHGDPMVEGAGFRVLLRLLAEGFTLDGFVGEEGGDVFVEELLVGGAGAGAGRVAPDRGNRQQGAVGDEGGFEAGGGDGGGGGGG